MGEFNLGAMAPSGMQFDLPQQKSGGGMFGNDRVNSAIAAAIAGFMARQSPHVSSAIFGQLQQAQSDKRQQAQHQQYREEGNADWLSHQQYEDAHRPPPQPGEFERALMASGVTPGTPDWTQAMKRRTDNMLDPIVMTPQGMMLRSQVMGAIGQPEILQSLPPGAKPLGAGGPVPQAPGGFPGY